jgi:DNA-binding SARP family transcriptional activator
VHIGLLGPFEVRLDDGAVTEVPGARLRGLLAALALEPGHVVPNATLVDWIWGERPPAEAANALQRLVSRLRKVLPEGLVEGQPGGYRLTVEPGAVDAVRFERLLGQARGDEGLLRVRLLREALALWRGPAMQDVGLAESSAFDAAVTRLDGLHLTAMEDRFDAEIGLGHGAVLVTELADAVAAHPLRERLVAALMRALAAAGRDSEALLVYQRTREALADELGADPSPALSAVHVALLRGELGRREDNSRKSNLRAELTSFVGKDADVAAVRDLIARHRLTTLTGPGGSGKTRLATETARTLLGDLPDGAWLVELAAIGADGDKGGGPRLDGQGSGALRAGGREKYCSGGAHRARPQGHHARRVTGRGADRSAHHCHPRAGGAADPGQLRARDRAGGGLRPPGAGGVPAAADPGDEPGTARHHRGRTMAGRAAGRAGR